MNHFASNHWASAHFSSNHLSGSVVVEEVHRSSGGAKYRHYAYDPYVDKKKKKKIEQKIVKSEKTIENLVELIKSDESQLRKVEVKHERKILSLPTLSLPQKPEVKKIIKALEAEEDLILERKARLIKKKREEEEILMMLMSML